jgi:hypothetical protein
VMLFMARWDLCCCMVQVHSSSPCAALEAISEACKHKEA